MTTILEKAMPYRYLNAILLLVDLPV